MNGWNKYEALLNEMGTDALLDELARTLEDNELGECMDYIAQNWDIEFED